MKCALLALVGLLAMTASAHAYKQEDLDKLKETRKCVGCDLIGADLTGANLSGANLSKANLSGANLSKADLFKANLTGANLSGANLSKASLSKAKLTGAKLIGANLGEANLTWANLGEADLFKANLTGALLVDADLSKANLTWANLGEANLTWANLGGAKLSRANLVEADLLETELSGADLGSVTMTNTRYEPVSAPRVETMASVEGLASLRWENSPHGLNLLREAFKKAGMREQERRVTYAIKHWDRVNSGGVEGVFSYILFEITSEFGMSPGRPLWILFVLIVVFSILYMQSVYVPEPNESGVWRVWPDDRVHERKNDKEPERVDVTGHRVVLWGLYFSLLSAFHIGWRDLNVGNWIARIHPKEFTLRATGWVKVVSGIQSLISVYLIALWALTYFGRPFE